MKYTNVHSEAPFSREQTTWGQKERTRKYLYQLFIQFSGLKDQNFSPKEIVGLKRNERFELLIGGLQKV